ncbi:MAG: recombination-associated protein RdgC, partial [Thermodesulfobacteriota bacterium]
SRYRLIGKLPENFPGFFNERIRMNAFRNVWRTADEKSAGWTGLDDPLDTDFPYASYALGQYLLFCLRVDRKSVAPSLLRLRVMEADRSKLAETGQKKLYREQREAIREAVRLELLGRSLPVPSFFEVCWSVPDHRLIFCSLSDKVFEELQELFRDSFQLTLCPDLPWDPERPGADPSRPDGGTGAPGGLPPHALPPSSPAQGGGSRFESLLPPATDPLAIGREFLTWLWFKSEERDGRIRLPDGAECEVFFIRRLVLESGDGEYAETVVCQGLHADLKEGKEALRQGKKISAARLRLTHDAADWEFTFKADRFQFQSMKLPSLPEADGEEIDRDGQLLERIALIEKAAGTMEMLFQSFMERRLAGDWEGELSRMQRWIL